MTFFFGDITEIVIYFIFLIVALVDPGKLDLPFGKVGPVAFRDTPSLDRRKLGKFFDISNLNYIYSFYSKTCLKQPLNRTTKNCFSKPIIT